MFRTKLNIFDGAIFTSVKPYFKNVLNSIEFPLGSIFLHNSVFPEKTYNCKNVGRKSFVNNRTIIFKIRNYAMEGRHQ